MPCRIHCITMILVHIPPGLRRLRLLPRIRYVVCGWTMTFANALFKFYLTLISYVLCITLTSFFVFETSVILDFWKVPSFILYFLLEAAAWVPNYVTDPPCVQHPPGHLSLLAFDLGMKAPMWTWNSGCLLCHEQHDRDNTRCLWSRSFMSAMVCVPQIRKLKPIPQCVLGGGASHRCLDHEVGSSLMEIVPL